MIQYKTWIRAFFLIILSLLLLIGVTVFIVDPFFHYHAPLTDWFDYSFFNERSQNDGIARNFDFDACIVGTSMIENAKTSEIDELFGTKTVKLPFSGGTLKETSAVIDTAFSSGKNLKLVIRSLDQYALWADESLLLSSDRAYPEYLLDDNPWNDVQYLLNKDVFFLHTLPAVFSSENGIESFDDYANWMHMTGVSFGKEAVKKATKRISTQGVKMSLTEEAKDMALNAIREYLVKQAQEHPDTEFYYFFPPYSIEKWRLWSTPDEVALMKLAVKECLQCENIKVFCFYDCYDMITNYENYRDSEHYGIWINSFIHQCMKDGKGRLTKENYENYFDQVLDYYTSYEYDE